MLRRVESFVKQYRLVSPGDRLLAAVSGGADSVAMLHVLHRLAALLGIDLAVAHLDHRIRGDAAAADAQFVADLASRLRLPCTVGRADVPGRARRKHLSLEMAARQARYDFLARTARTTNASSVATAHTADDQAETVILNLARGAGPAGLGGIPRRIVLNGVDVVRPLLGVTRKQVVAYLNANNLSWREDASNRDMKHLRNRVRHQVLPLLARALNPKVRQALARTAELMHEENQWGDRAAAKALADCLAPGAALALPALLNRPKAEQRRVLRLWLAAAGIPAEEVSFDVMSRLNTLARSGRAGGDLQVGGQWTVRKQYDAFLAPRRNTGRHRPSAFRQPVAVPGETLLAAPPLRIVTRLAPGIVRPKAGRPGDLPARASISRAAMGRKKLFVRSWRDGDRISPLGMNGSKKLQDIFVDQKVPVTRRPEIPIIECGGDIVWLPGYRVARGWEVKDASTDAVQICVTVAR